MCVHQPMVVYLCVSECICVSADMLPYCSAHDEWLIMKLLQVCQVHYCIVAIVIHWLVAPSSQATIRACHGPLAVPA